jgi:uncharacterized protein YdiU (UPF0061 family)
MAKEKSLLPENQASEDGSAKNESKSLKRKLGAAQGTITKLRQELSGFGALEEKRYQDALEKGALKTESESMKKLLDRLVDALAVANVDFRNEIQEFAARFGNEKQELSKEIISLRERIAAKEKQILEEREAGKSWYPEFVTRTALSDAERIRRLATSLTNYRTRVKDLVGNIESDTGIHGVFRIRNKIRATLARNSDLIADSPKQQKD